ncbi:MAG: hypothetical protein LBV33_09005, partial [Lachnospiraceae bacterium]|nr:hypothetical protein [Lachnospiraceae bacterium]
MGMPVITPGTGSRDQAITDLVESVALQETALSHILNAEGEKMQAIIAMPDATPEQLMELNRSVNKMINAVTRLEMMLQSKLELFADVVNANPTPVEPLTAPAQLALIDVPEVTIDVPLDAPTAQDAAVALVEAAAQLQIAEGYLVNFIAESYGPVAGPAPLALLQAVAINYVLTGKFTVTLISNTADTATNVEIQVIIVLSSVLPETTAADELSLINVTSVSIDVPLTDPAAEGDAIDQAVAAAQAQVATGYTVTFAATGFDPATGIMTGKFTVTNDADPTDVATDTTDRSITVTTTAVSPDT